MPLQEQVFACVTKGDLNRLISLLNKTPTMVNIRNEDGISLLQYSVLQDQVDVLIYLTNISECQLSQSDLHYEHTALHTACVLDTVKMAQTIIQRMKPSEVSAQDKFGWTALHHAARNGNVALCKLLIQHNSKMDIRNELGKTPIHYAAQYGFLEIVKLLYEFVGPSVTPSPIEHFSLPVLTLLHLGAMNNHCNVIEWLQTKLYPPTIKCRRALHQNGDITSEELSEDSANKRGHYSLKANLQAYYNQYDMWLQDITGDCNPLDYAKLCLCGPVDSGKTTLKELLEKNNLQLILGRGLESTESPENSKKYTYGVDVSLLYVNSKDSFSLWDFCGASDSYVTHSYFTTTEHTVYVIVLDLTKSTDTLKKELDEWLCLIKNHNLGGKLVYTANRRHPDIVTFSNKIVPAKANTERHARSSTISHPTKFRDRLMSSTLRPSKPSQSTSPIRSQSTNLSPTSTSDVLSCTKPIEAEILPLILSVPVLVAGSHFDCLQDKAKKETLGLMNDIISNASRKFRRSLNILPQLFPVSGGDRTSSSEIRFLKEQLSTARTTLLENCHTFPRVFDKVAKKIESMKLECPETKVIEFIELCDIIQSQVNRLLSETQIDHILKHMNNIGMIVYIQPMKQWVFTDPTWFCNTIGYLLSPQTHPHYMPVKNGEICRKMIQNCLPTCKDVLHLNMAFKIVRNLELGYTTKAYNGSEVYNFCSKSENDESAIWVGDDKYVKYIGRQMITCDDNDIIPTGFVSYLQSQVSFLQHGKNVITFDRGLILDYSNYQCLVKVMPNNRSISLIGRICDINEASSCLSSLDCTQLSVAKLCRIMCPAIFFKWLILNPVDLKNHAPSLRSCPVSAVIAYDKKGVPSVLETAEDIVDSPLNMMFFGDDQLMVKGTGMNVKVAYLDDFLLEKMDDLLIEDGIQPGWKQLAEHINLSDYIEYLEGERHPTKKLLLKWGEKPRWTVDSLLFALKGMKRVDVYDYVRAKTNPKYEIVNGTLTP